MLLPTTVPIPVLAQQIPYLEVLNRPQGLEHLEEVVVVAAPLQPLVAEEVRLVQLPTITPQAHLLALVCLATMPAQVVPSVVEAVVVDYLGANQLRLDSERRQVSLHS